MTKMYDGMRVRLKEPRGWIVEADLVYATDNLHEHESWGSKAQRIGLDRDGRLPAGSTGTVVALAVRKIVEDGGHWRGRKVYIFREEAARINESAATPTDDVTFWWALFVDGQPQNIVSKRDGQILYIRGLGLIAAGHPDGSRLWKDELPDYLEPIEEK